jgi:transcriptional regulator with XRE-family HTH domain
MAGEETLNTRSLGRELRRQREAARLTQQELAGRSGVGVKTISRIEAGLIQDPGFADVVRMGRALGLSPDTLATYCGLWQVNDEDAGDPRWDYIDGFMGRATPEQRDQYSTLAYATALALDRIAEAGPLPHIVPPAALPRKRRARS